MNYDELVIGKEYWCKHPDGMWEGPVRLDKISDAEIWLAAEGTRKCFYFYITILENIHSRYQVLEKGRKTVLAGGFEFKELNISLENE